MAPVNPYDHLVAARVSDFLKPRGLGWHGALWAIGSVLTLNEIVEASEAASNSVLSDRALRYLQRRAQKLVGPDPGAGDPALRSAITGKLKSELRYGSVEYLTLQELVKAADLSYLKNWRDHLWSDGQPAVELTARLLASHLLDAGFTPQFLHEWWQARVGGLHAPLKLPELLDEAASLLARPCPVFEVLVGFSRAPRSRGRPMPTEWRDGRQAARWLRERGHSTTALRLAGGLVLRIPARDEWAAVQKAYEIVERLVARISIAAKAELQPHKVAWVAGQKRKFGMQRSQRGVRVKSVNIENHLYTVGDIGTIDSALEFVGTMDCSAAAPAVASGWAALEALLTGPGSGGNRFVAAERAARIIACSFPRAELTRLAYVHLETRSDALSSAIRSASTNREKATLVADAILKGEPVGRRTLSDELARRRMEGILKEPSILNRVAIYVADALHRLYRQRNLVLHWGKVDSICLEPCLRTAAPLVGAAVDRIAHAWFTEKKKSLELAARAESALALLTSSLKQDLCRLLE